MELSWFYALRYLGYLNGGSILMGLSANLISYGIESIEVAL